MAFQHRFHLLSQIHLFLKSLLLSCFALVFSGLFMPLHAQRVGLVLSGGGAKGLAHIGVIKALEEHQLPIDYLTGTSMGSIVAALYAAGYSPQEMEAIVLAPDFQNWVKGKALEVYDFNSVQKLNDPSWVSVDVALDSSFNAVFSPNIASDVSINFALLEILVQSSVRVEENFDKLMVPIRVIAADVFTQKEIIVQGAPLHRATRASMTVPFFFRPIRLGDMLLFDGGLYDNFPVKVMEEHFKPDFIIGSNVAVKKYSEYPYGQNDQKLLNQDMVFMFLDKTDPSKLDGKGLYLEPNLTGYTALDFDKVAALIDSGYRATKRLIPQLERTYGRRVSAEQLAKKRSDFRAGMPDLVIDKVKVYGYNQAQSTYLSKLLSGVSDKNSSIEDVRKAYYQLLANDLFKDIYPDLKYDPQRKVFDFELYGTPNDRVKVDVGGNIGSKRVSSLYFALRYSNLSNTLNTYGFNLYTGRFYQSFQLSARKTFSPKSLAYIEPIFTFNQWDYINSQNVIFGNNPVGVLNQIDRFFGLNGGLATGSNSRINARLGYFSNKDQFRNELGAIKRDSLDLFRMNGLKIGAEFSRNNLNRKQYASKGTRVSMGVHAYTGSENYEPGDFSDINNPEVRIARSWVRLSASAEQYFFHRKKVRLGYLAQWEHSTQPAFHNYVSSLANAPAFNPLQDSRTLLLVNFRAPAFVAGGIRNVYELSPKLDFRLEAYSILAYRRLQELPNFRAGIDSGIDQVHFAAAATMVYHSPLGPIALSYNHYDDPYDQKGLFLHIGYILFNRRSLE